MLYDSKEFIGKVIKSARKRRGLTQGELAELSGLAEKSISNIENGRQFPALNNFFRILELLNLSLEDFGVNRPDCRNLEKFALIEEIYTLEDEVTEVFSEILKLSKKLTNVSSHQD